MTKAQLVEELAAVRARLAELEAQQPSATDPQVAPADLLSRTADIFQAAQTDADLYDRVLAVLLQATGSEVGLFGYIREDGAFIVPTMSAQAWEQCRVPGRPVVFPRDEWGDGLWGQALRSQRLLHSNAAARVPDGHIPIARNLCVPIVFRGDTIGLLHLANKPTDYDAGDLEVCRAVAEYIAPLLNAHVERDRYQNGRAVAEAWYRRLVDAAFEGVWVIDRDGVTTYANRALGELLGYAPEEILGRSFLEFMDEHWRAEALSRLERRRQGIAEQHEFTFRRRDGSALPTLINTVPLTSDGGEFEGALAMVADITERKQAEEALAAAARDWQTTFNGVSDGVLVLEPGGTILRCNRVMTEVLGRSADELLGRPCWEVVHGTNAAVPGCPREAALASRQRESMEVPVNGHWIRVVVDPVFDDEGDLQSLVHTWTDITVERQAAERQTLAVRILQLLNDRDDPRRAIETIIRLVKMVMGMEAVGLRLREGDDFPYFVVNGLSDDFVKSEGYLCVHDEQGRLLLDSTGCPVLECMCGNVLCGRTDPTLPFFTPGGSFWTNSTTDLLASTTETERQARTRNRCHGEGYESVALIPLRSGDDVIGLLQLCDHERNRFTRETIEFLEGMGASIGVALARIQADETLANSEAKFRALYETTPDAVMLLDAEGFLDCNPSTLRVFGCESREEFLGKHPSELSPPSQPGGRDSRTAADEHIARALTEGTDHFEWLHQRVDGSPFPADVLLSRLELGRAPVLQAVVRDITDRKRMEQRQARTVALLRAVLEAVDDLMLTDSVDALCRRAVELARERLGLERCSIYVVEGDDLRGTYGTSLEGQTTAEHDVLLPGAAGTVSRHNLPPGAQWWTVEHAARTTQVDGQMVELEPGWVAWTQIPTAQGVAGVLFNDAAVSGAPPDDVQQDVVAVYCSLLVGLIEMKRIGEELRTSEERLRAMVETSPDGIVLVDPETLGFLEFNEAACRQLGYAPGGLDGLRVTDIDVAQSAAQVRANAARLAGGERLGFETKQRTQSGEVRDVWVVARQLWFGERPVIFAVFRDITDQRRSEQEQVRLLALNQATVDTVPSALLVLDEGLNVLMTNRPCSTIQGAGQADPVDRNLLDLFPPELLQTQGLLGRIQAVAAGGPPDELLALPHESPSDPPQYLDIRLSGFEVADEEGHPQRRVLVAIDDVTHQRTLEEQIGQMSKLEAIGTLAGGVAHDFSNILTGILGYADIIAQEGLAPSAQQEIGVIRELSQRAAGLTRQLLAFSRRQPLQTRTVDLNDLIAELTRMLARLIGEHVTQVLSLAPDLVTVRADPGQIEQVIMNLAVNARDAMPDGGTLTIETANAVLDEAYAATHAGVTPGEYALVAVSDTGKGMDEATCARIFEPFFTTKGVGEGTGLGLATVYGIVKQHGGNIWVYSEPGCGTTFKIYLPLAGNEAEVAAQPAPPPEASRGEETILLVEDDPSVLEIAQRALESHGYRVLVVADPAQAEGVLDAYEGEVALVVTDVVMPNLFGPALVERLQAGRPSLRVLYMSGYTRGAATGNGTLPHDVPFLNKPFTPSVLAAKVREVLGA